MFQDINLPRSRGLDLVARTDGGFSRLPSVTRPGQHFRPRLRAIISTIRRNYATFELYQRRAGQYAQERWRQRGQCASPLTWPSTIRQITARIHPVRVLANPCERRGPVYDGPPLDAGDVTAGVNREEAQPLERAIIVAAHWGYSRVLFDPILSRRCLASDRMEWIDVKRTWERGLELISRKAATRCYCADWL